MSEELIKKAFEYRRRLIPTSVDLPVYAYTALDVDRAYIAGAKENGVIWHDLRKNPDDLPEEGEEVLNDCGVKVVRIKGHWRYVYGDAWEDDAHLDHWCEIPEFEVE